MECEYICLNPNLLMSPKKCGHQGHDYKRGLLYLKTWAIRQASLVCRFAKNRGRYLQMTRRRIYKLIFYLIKTRHSARSAPVGADDLTRHCRMRHDCNLLSAHHAVQSSNGPRRERHVISADGECHPARQGTHQDGQVGRHH